MSDEHDSYLRCTVCGRRSGWEKCCGYTMRLVRTEADIEAATTSALRPPSAKEHR